MSMISYLLGVRHVGFAIWGDSHYYYAYTRSLVMDHDVNFINEATNPLYPFPNGLKVVPKTGYAASNFSPGPGLLWIPGFLLGQFVVWGLSWFGVDVLRDGYSLINQVSVGLSTVMMSLGGLFLIYLNLKHFFKHQVALVSVLVLFLTSQLFYYTTIDPLNSHSAELLFSSLALFLALKIYLNQLKGDRWYFLFGLVLGFLGIIRNQDILISALLLALVFFRKSKFFKLKQLLFVLVPLSLVVSIQVIFTWTIYHRFGSPYLINGASFSWLYPNLLDTLFSQGNGFFYFAPMGLIMVLGLIWWYLKAPRLNPAIKQIAGVSLGVFLSQLYVIASWPPEIIGGPYGSRMFIGTLPFLAFGLAWIVKQLKKQALGYKLVSVLVLGLLFGWNLYQIYLMLATW